jgi:pimeloyl-ACP methyl ester carboxylesterase
VGIFTFACVQPGVYEKRMMAFDERCWLTQLFLRLSIATIAVVCVASLRADSIQKYSFPPPGDVDRADVYAVQTVAHPDAVLVLCPGCNGSGEGLVRQTVWQQFARENRLGLVGISFATPSEFLNAESNRGYYIASKGSGQVLLEAIRKIYGKDLPLLLYGFSGGAQFTSRFVEWKPERVKTWCAYSAGWWDEPKKSSAVPPGIVACGDYDASRYGVSLIYFKQGRALGKPWLWVSLPKMEHAISGEFENFTRKYFASVLNSPSAEGQWVDVDLKKAVSPEEAKANRSVTAWLPDRELFEMWRRIHEP